MAKIDTLDALETANVDRAKENDNTHQETPPLVSASSTETKREPTASPTDEKTDGAVARADNRSAWYRALGLAEPMMSALASSPGMLASEKHFTQSAEQLTGAVNAVAKMLKERQQIPGIVAFMVAAPLCAASWQIQVEQQKNPVIDPEFIANVAIQFNEAMGDDVEFPVRQLPYIARSLIENSSAPTLFGTNFRETLRGMSGVSLAESADGENSEKAGIVEAHEYFLARLSAFRPERIGEAVHAAREYMRPTDQKGIQGWHTLAFWGNDAKDERAKEMLGLALATQIAIGDNWYAEVQKRNPELCKVLVNMSRRENTHLIAKAAREYADRVEHGTHIDLADVEKLSSTMCTAMREGMTVFHNARANIFTATENMLKKKYPLAKTSDAMREAMEKEQWGTRVKGGYQSAKILREGIFSAIRGDVDPLSLSVSMKIRAAVGAAVAPLLKPSNARILATAFPFIPENATPNEACNTVVNWGETAVRSVSNAVASSLDISKSDRQKMQGRIEKVLQEVMEHTDVVSRCAKQGKPADIFPEMVKELRTVVQVTVGILPERVRERCTEPLKTALMDVGKRLNEEFRDAGKQESPSMENEAAKQSDEEGRSTSSRSDIREDAD
jgi:hypothetical protein